MTNHLVSNGDKPRLVLLTGHSAPIDSIAFSPDGRTLATGSLNGTVILWDLPTGAIRARLQGDGWNVRLAFSPDGATLATVDADGIRLRETATGRWLGTLPGYRELVAFAGRTELLSRDRGGNLVRLDSESGSVLDRFPLTTGELQCDARVLSSNASSIVIVVFRGSPELRVWDLKTGKFDPWLGAEAHLDQLSLSPSQPLAISPDHRVLAVGSGQTVQVWDLHTGSLIPLPLCGINQVEALAFSPNDQLLAVGISSGEIKLWAIPSGHEVQSLAAHTAWASGIAFSPGGEWLASTGFDSSIKLWDLATGECRQRLPGRAHEVLCVSFSPNGRTFASGHEDGTVRYWDASTGRLLRTLYCHGNRVTSLSFSGDGRTLACSSIDLFMQENPGMVELWDLETGERLQGWETGVGSIDAVSLIPQGPFVVASRCRGMDEETCVWNRDNGELCYRVKGRAAALSPDGTLLATALGWEGVSLWGTATGAKIRDLTASDWVAALRFSPDGSTLLAGYLGFGMGLWSVATGDSLWEAGTHADAITSLAFSPDGRQVAVGGAYASEWVLWHLQPQVEERLTLYGHESSVRAVSFHPEGRKLITASADGTLKVWDTAEGRLLATYLVLPTTDGSVSEEWITFTPSGRYVGSAGAEEFVRWQVGEELLPAGAFRGEFHRPALVAEALG